VRNWIDKQVVEDEELDLNATRWDGATCCSILRGVSRRGGPASDSSPVGISWGREDRLPKAAPCLRSPGEKDSQTSYMGCQRKSDPPANVQANAVVSGTDASPEAVQIPQAGDERALHGGVGDDMAA